MSIKSVMVKDLYSLEWIWNFNLSEKFKRYIFQEHTSLVALMDSFSFVESKDDERL